MLTFKRIYIFVILSSSFLLTFCQNRENLYADYYNFEVLGLDSIEPRKSWGVLPNSLFDITQQKVNGEEFISLKPMEDTYGVQWPIYATLLQSFIVKNPKEKNKIRVEISTKGNHTNSSILFLKGVDTLGNEVFCDEFSIKDSNEWQVLKHSAEMPLGTNEFLVGLEIKGDTIQNQYFSLKKNVKIYLNEVYLPNLSLDGVTGKEEYLQQAVSVPYEEIGKQLSKEISDKPAKVIAFGEPLHGSKEFPDVFFQLFRDQVEHNKVRMVLFEMPVVKAMRWNHFITNKNSIYTIDSLVKMDYLGSFDPDFFKKILLWTKEYNIKNADKVQFFGIDSESNFIKEADLGNFLYEVNAPKRNSLLDSLFLKLDFSSNQKMVEVLDFMETNQISIRQLLNESEYEVIHQYIKNISQFSTNVLLSYSPNREAWMFQIAKTHINRLNPGDKALLYGHWMHLNDVCLEFKKGNTKTLGGYLLEEYKNQYFRVGGLAYEGSFIGKNFENKFKLGYLKSPKNTLTYFLKERQEEYLVFSPVDMHKVAIIPIYGVTNTSIASYQVARLSNIIDAGFFIKKVTDFTPNSTKGHDETELEKSILYRDRREHLRSKPQAKIK